MKKYVTKEFDLDTRVCGFFNNSPLAITRTHIDAPLHSEVLHSHNESYEYYIFIKGKAKLLIDDKIIVVGPGDVIVAEPNEKHKILDVIETVDYITIKTNNDPLDKIVHEENSNEIIKECLDTEKCLIQE